jgi:hypothetical protein
MAKVGIFGSIKFETIGIKDKSRADAFGDDKAQQLS